MPIHYERSLDGATPGRFARHREELIRKYAAQVEADAVEARPGPSGGPARDAGASRGVKCLTATDPGTGRPRVFPSLRAAAEWVGRRPFAVARAIDARGRDGRATCGGHAWEWAAPADGAGSVGPGRPVVCLTRRGPDGHPLRAERAIDMARQLGLHEDAFYKALRRGTPCGRAKDRFAYAEDAAGDPPRLAGFGPTRAA